MTDAFDLEIRYGSEIKIAKTFLSSKTRKAGRTPANPEQKQHFLDMDADCPLCGDPFHDGNHNTEHIFPISLGGKNTSENRIQLCRMCNNSRNKVMQSTFADNPKSAYPEKWVHIKKILLWHIITIDDGIDAGKLIPSVHELFMTYATGGKPFPNQPKRAYGRYSTWKVGDEPNYLHNNSSINKKPNPPSTKSVTLSFFDWVFGYKSKDRKSPISKPKQLENGYPVTQYLNSASEGLQFPREPTTFANVLLWFSKNMQKHDNHSDCRDTLKETGIVNKSRVISIMISLYRVIDEEYNAVVQKFATHTPIEICEIFKNYYSENDISGMRTGKEAPNIKVEISEYLDAATLHLVSAEEVA